MPRRLGHDQPAYLDLTDSALQRDFIANISHELKTPVGTLIVLAETMSVEEDPEVLRRLAVRVLGESERIGHMIEELLDFSEEQHRFADERDPVDLRGVVSDAIDRVRPAAHAKDVRLDVDVVPGHLWVEGSRRQLVSALSNLVENGVKYSAEHGGVCVRVMESEGYLEVSIDDGGIGIAPADIERIFERFYRAEAGRHVPGTGLGLAIVRQVAENHGGDVTVRSVEGRGSRFTLRLPAVRALDAHEPLAR